MKEDNKAVQKAKKVLEEISQDERERYLAELRQKYIMDQKAMIDAGYDKGLDKGLKQGLEQGLEEGLKQGLEQGLEEGLKQGLEQGLEEGIKQGLEQGIQQGREQGEKNKSIEIAKKLKNMKMNIEDIQRATGLTKKEIENF